MRIEIRYNDDKTIGRWHPLEGLDISEPLRAAISETLHHFFPNAQEVRIEHVGTYGDAAHSARDSRHNDKPPAAIDVRWIDVTTGHGLHIHIDFTKNQNNRRITAEFWEKLLGAKAYHADDHKKHHIHLQAVA